MCPCGSEVFKVLVQIDPEDKEIGWYTLTGYCYLCEARVTIACPADMADDTSYVTV